MDLEAIKMDVQKTYPGAKVTTHSSGAFMIVDKKGGRISMWSKTEKQAWATAWGNIE